MVRESSKGHAGEISAAQWVSHFEIILTAAHLTDVTPIGRWIGPQRVVHPFANFMTQRLDISTDQRRGVEIGHGVSLQWPGSATGKERIVVTACDRLRGK